MVIREICEKSEGNLSLQKRDANTPVTNKKTGETKTAQEWWDASPDERKRILLADELQIGFAQGKFDEWCVYVRHDEPRDNNRNWVFYWATDKFYFSFIHVLGCKSSRGFTPDMVYKDLLSVYNMQLYNIGKIDDNVLEYIRKISFKYGDFKDDVLLWFSVIYFAMIAEENKENAIAGSLIKIVAIHDVLLNNRPVEDAATCDVGQNVKTILRKGFDLGIHHPSLYKFMIDMNNVTKEDLDLVKSINGLSIEQRYSLDKLIYHFEYKKSRI